MVSIQSSNYLDQTRSYGMIDILVDTMHGFSIIFLCMGVFKLYMFFVAEHLDQNVYRHSNIGLSGPHGSQYSPKSATRAVMSPTEPKRCAD